MGYSEEVSALRKGVMKAASDAAIEWAADYAYAVGTSNAFGYLTNDESRARIEMALESLRDVVHTGDRGRAAQAISRAYRDGIAGR